MKTEILEELTKNRFSVKTTRGNYYAQECQVEFFSTLEAAKKAYHDYDFSQKDMSCMSRSGQEDQPTIRIELRELKTIAEKLLKTT